jgi:dienelactone hydrolase
MAPHNARIAPKRNTISSLPIKAPLLYVCKKIVKSFGFRGKVLARADAPHAFFNDTRESYRSEAAKDAWERTLKFYNKYLNHAI